MNAPRPNHGLDDKQRMMRKVLKKREKDQIWRLGVGYRVLLGSFEWNKVA
jgi:hypothetical protein